jgi:hypothetical protein
MPTDDAGQQDHGQEIDPERVRRAIQDILGPNEGRKPREIRIEFDEGDAGDGGWDANIYVYRF